jgi:hypothetical protein
MASPTFAWTARFVAEQLDVAEDLVDEIAAWRWNLKTDASPSSTTTKTTLRPSPP